MKTETVDVVAEREFRFRFKGLNFFELHDFFIALQDFGGSVELVSSNGVRWIPKDGENLLRRYFSEPGMTHTARAKTEKELKLYRSVFDNFSKYVEYK